MKVNPRDLRIDPPRSQPPAHVVEQLAALAAQSAATAAPRRGAIVAGVTAGVLALGMGGAWASGTIEVPGLPKPRHTAPVDPSPPPPTDDTPATGDTPEPPRPTGEDPDHGRPSDGRDKQMPGPTTDKLPGKGADRGSGGQSEERRPDHGATPDSPGRSDHSGKPDSPGRNDDLGKPDDPGKPDDLGKPGDVGNTTAPRGSGAEKPGKPRSEPPARTAERERAASDGAARTRDQRDG